MGFIPQVSTKTLYAYLTPLGRQYILDGNKEDFQVAYFSLHDDDVNYFISSNISSGTAYYTLQSGFVPDITGDADTCIKSIAKGTGVNNLSTLSGSTIIDPITGKPTVGPIGSDGTIGARNTRIAGPTITTINDGTLIAGRRSYSTSLIVTITPPLGDINPATTAEIANSKFYIEIMNPSSIIDNITISGISTNKLLYTPSSTSTRVDIGYALTVSPSTNTNITFGIKIIPFNTSSPVNNSSINYTAIYPATTTTGPVRGTTPTDTTTPNPGTSFGGGAGGSSTGVG
jgi:hypothetical protein